MHSTGCTRAWKGLELCKNSFVDKSNINKIRCDDAQLYAEGQNKIDCNWSYNALSKPGVIQDGDVEKESS